MYERRKEIISIFCSIRAFLFPVDRSRFSSQFVKQKKI